MVNIIIFLTNFFVIVEMEFVKLVIELFGFIIFFEDVYDYFDIDKNLKFFIWRNL